MAAHRVTTERPQGGFTLIEVMISILLTALTVIGVVALFRVETRASSFSRRTTEASILAQDKLEELRTLAAPTAGVTTTETTLDALGRTSAETGTTIGHIFTRTSAVTLSADPSVYDITVIVSWDDDGIPRTVTVNANRGGG